MLFLSHVFSPLATAPSRRFTDASAERLLSLPQVLSDACLNVVKKTQDIQMIQAFSQLGPLEHNLASYEQDFSHFQGQLMQVSIHDQGYFLAWKIIQELAVLIHGYRQCLIFAHERLRSGHHMPK